VFGSLANSADWSILKEYEGLIDQLIGVWRQNFNVIHV
jgi:hypothetical protein